MFVICTILEVRIGGHPQCGYSNMYVSSCNKRWSTIRELAILCNLEVVDVKSRARKSTYVGLYNA